MKDNIRNDKLINYNHIIEEENTPGPSLSRAGTIDIKNLTNNELNQKVPFSILAQQPFEINGEIDDIPIHRQVIHRQQIIISKRVSFEIELSFEKIKFFIIVRRQILGPLTKAEKREKKKELKLSGGDIKDIAISAKTKMYGKTLWLSQAKQLIKLFDVELN